MNQITEMQGEINRLRAELERTRRVALMCAASCQGGHSDAGRAAADLFSIPFPITMSNLLTVSERYEYDPQELWRWFCEQRRKKTEPPND